MRKAGIRVLIADDHPVVIEGVEEKLANSPDISVVGTATSFAQVLDILQTVVANVVILDLLGMKTGPITMVNRLRRDYPRMEIVVFSSTIDLAPELISAGVQGYILKEDQVDLLITAIQSAYRQQAIISPAVAEYLRRADLIQEQVSISPREHHVLRLLATGLHTNQIAHQLDIDPRTAQNYISTLRRKTGCLQRNELIDWYRRILGQDTA